MTWPRRPADRDTAFCAISGVVVPPAGTLCGVPVGEHHGGGSV
ncbi:hypothetical protein AB0H83_21515 [Dactylosporangium sp. NPDC050688]